MQPTDLKYTQYLQILREELIPAMGCTEPIAMAYAAAKAREVLGALPEKIDIVISGNIIKNVKSVIVPNTGGLKGITAAIAAGAAVGNADRQLEVLADVKEDEISKIAQLMESCAMTVMKSESGTMSAFASPISTRTSCSSRKTARCFSGRTARRTTAARPTAAC